MSNCYASENSQGKDLIQKSKRVAVQADLAHGSCRIGRDVSSLHPLDQARCAHTVDNVLGIIQRGVIC
jgi:hypothetical protein